MVEEAAVAAVVAIAALLVECAATRHVIVTAIEALRGAWAATHRVIGYATAARLAIAAETAARLASVDAIVARLEAAEEVHREALRGGHHRRETTANSGDKTR